MSKNTPNILNLKLELDKSDFLLATCQQINKDLAGFGSKKIEIPTDFNSPPLPFLSAQMCEIIHLLEQMNKIQQFIYLVDLKESIFKSFCAKTLHTEDLAYEIIKREAQKVYLRHYFSQYS